MKMIIDAHNHPDWYGYDITGFLSNMDMYDIDKTWVLSWECPEDEYDPFYRSVVPGSVSKTDCGPIPFSRCVSYAQQAPDRFVPGYAPDPRRPFAIDKLKSAIDSFGIKICGEIKLRMVYDDPDALRMFRFCGEKGLPVTVHIDYELADNIGGIRPNWWYGGGIEAFERVLSKCPDTVFLGHAPGFWAHISGDDLYDKCAYPKGKIIPGGKLIELLKKHRNLYCDLSAGSGLNALKRDPGFAVGFIDEFQDRLLYARDSFDNQHQGFLDGLVLSDDILAKIYYVNALKLIHEL
jgi:predicted TIM-barrel fold metal-dependent hydrolase